MRGVKCCEHAIVVIVFMILFLGVDLNPSFGQAKGSAELIQLQQRLDALGKAGGGTLQLPAGEIALSAGCSEWTSNHQSTDGDDPFTVGLLIPSHVRIIGAGMGKTVFRYARVPGDPVCSLFANVDRVNGNAGVSFSDLSIVTDDQTGPAGTANSSYSAPIYMNRVSGFHLERVEIKGNTDRQVNLMDMNGVNIRSCLFLVNSTGYGYGDSSIGINRSGTLPLTNASARIENNNFAQIGRYPNFSIIVTTANDVRIANNFFDLQTYRPGVVGGNAIEIGPNTSLEAPNKITIESNTILGGEVWPLWASNIRIKHNLVVNGGIGMAAADVTTTTSLSNVFITHNLVQFGSIQAKATTAGTLSNLLIADNQVEDGWIQAQGNLAGAVVLRNSVRNSPEDGIDCYGCTEIAYNRVENVGQSDPWNSASIAINVAPVFASSFWVNHADHNMIVDNQGDYNIGQVCAVRKKGASQCINGPGRFVILAAGTWNPLWTNRTLYVNGAALLIRRFVSLTELELEKPAVIPPGSAYQLYRTTAFAFQLYANIDSFSYNSGDSAEGWRGAAIIQQNAAGMITVNSWQSNQFSPYSCSNCSYFY
jgi:hypothetical protein